MVTTNTLSRDPDSTKSITVRQSEMVRIQPETLYKGDDALSTKPVMHYQGTAYLCY